ncbi:ATP-dependent endonuclease [Pseudomonas sp. UME83]|nr:ATP-dependent endonuclease [Pseudomonas sp. UMC76]MBB1636587.1 ATP-dependent endonuclease [Pseudomonas sp. UME83]NTX92245.1 ATP-dependent endonuclease [Pseudomonas sp. UMA643]NTY19973.1 ATP-dependent endonuclease [Pseudomonas sp. UMC3103]NTY27655.1 ATP-dependent endonuclease [Pseudomonas sp. UMA603]NTY33233.1 ATP-dependent endonuclease [Pseudomonas sp. UMC3129]NTY56781.1 ATP-dependent endonuclease [Pseudomonas sp. UMC631]NUA32773.1 ATP-dependent endonuclease [Pseudomonas sp. UMA601]
MHVHSLTFKNFRRLKAARIDFANDLTIFVGANNSGKTSATHAIELFLSGGKEKFTVHDFCAGCWADFESFSAEDAADAKVKFPAISLDVWISVDADNLYRVVELLPRAAWEGSLVGLRIEFAAKDAAQTLVNFRAKAAEAAKFAKTKEKDGQDYKPWPRNMRDYLSRELKNEYGLRYFILDEAQLKAETAAAAYTPKEIIGDAERSGHTVINSLIKVDFLSAQRHLSDGSAQARTEDLSKRLSRFYTRNQKQREEDHNALGALALSEDQLTKHFADVFSDTFKSLRKLGYPGLANPTLEIRAALKLERLMGDQQAKVHYLLEEATAEGEALALPDSYNGLGFKNLIYMGVELLDLHSAWSTTEEGEEDKRQPIHLIFIEEPEAHMHAQLQQAFVRKLTDLISPTGDDGYATQFVITTHSPHILYERGFQPIRYFRRSPETGAKQSSAIFNLSAFYDQNEFDRDFLQRYMKLTHCDLFFADAAILVEGNVERLVLPLMIEQGAKRLSSAYLSILEVGGAFAYRFRKLIEFLGLPTLIVTDLDSVHPASSKKEEETTAGDGAAAEAAQVLDDAEEEDDDGEQDAQAEKKPKPKSKCPASTPGAVTANQTLRQWLPGKSLVDELLAAPAGDRLQAPTADGGAHVMVAYQGPVNATWGKDTLELKSRTLEEAFAYENLVWCQKKEHHEVGLRWSKSSTMSLEELAAKIHKRVKGESFKKTNFALGLLASSDAGWVVPAYIQEGLDWLTTHVAISDDTIGRATATLEPAPEAALSAVEAEK